MKLNVIFIILFLGGFGLFGAGMFLGSFFSQSNQPKQSAPTVSAALEWHQNTGKLTSPLLICNPSTHIDSEEFRVFEQKLTTDVNELVKNNKADHIAIYFRKLLDGSWFGINEDEIFTPASLLKVPNMIALYKQADANPEILNKKLRYEKVYFQDKPYYEAPEKLELGKEYTVDELISRMVRFSDNESMFLLKNNFDQRNLETLYKDLHMLPPDDSISNDFMTIQNYALFFRVLFNASYISEAMSQKALEILTTISFDKGLVRGVPADIKVAHKFGERTYTDDNTKQLHDCGIIYYPNNPYLLCIMSKGENFDSLASVIETLSKNVWDEMNAKLVK